ncbi:hypothetical protein PputGB1_4255 [Pseudomonas putida GB-1]|uniref:Uncharacterized protein n=1 Tax=Pseudomonas putida (strain GB-1) TaxID=76869 RepID=B0KTP6_PSEPG|nr:hypothetical protein PputGB1_4255 [Pseudomonas putida GB-1]
MDAWNHAHWETSCKVYAPLKKHYLDRNSALPQILVTDSFVHDVYAYRYNDHYADDCMTPYRPISIPETFAYSAG